MAPPPCVAVDESTDLAAALRELGLSIGRPALVVVGGAAGLEDHATDRLIPALEALCEVAGERGAVIVDGGTDSGVMALLGDLHSALGVPTPLVGVGVASLVGAPGETGVAPEPHHTHFVLVPGARWGDETPWLARVASALAAGQPSATVLVNGGDIALTDVRESVDAGRPVLVLAGSGRVSEELVRALRGGPGSAEVASLAGNELVTAVCVDDPDAMKAAVRALLE
ncbi:MAG: hypothetical protein QOG15_3811 [Solirubrobacteraceae bacterium]|jgi:hypothetical protein|nr:hypothetical protein [Solirubrobacteraceae bacterium]